MGQAAAAASRVEHANSLMTPVDMMGAWRASGCVEDLQRRGRYETAVKKERKARVPPVAVVGAGLHSRSRRCLLLTLSQIAKEVRRLDSACRGPYEKGSKNAKRL